MAKIIETPILETKRLILRPITLNDVPAIQKHFNNWNIIKNLLDTVPWPYPDDGAENHVKNNVLPRIKKGEAFVWTLNLKKEPSKAIGLIEFRYITNRKDDRGFWLAEPFWGQGLMTEAVTAVNDFVFDELKIEKYTVCNAHGNEGSRRAKEKTGAVWIGTKKIKHHQGVQESDVWEMTAENWKNFRKENL